MRKAQKAQAIKLVELLNQSHDEIKKYIESNNLAIALDLLAQCQSGAIELGNFIEGFEGEDCATVRIIEEYCELIYNVHEEISKIVSCNQAVNGNKIYKNLRKKLIQIENSVKNDIPLRKEVVFLPYKASMWDSLESIYFAASKDPDCDAYVIPIPYYDRNPDGSMGQEHYEIDLYPEDIPVTRYDTYDFGKRRPDMIFIHNPYDYDNMITSVHPFFYSDKMKKCTDCLVYVPYFATSGGQAESQASLPAYYNADYIVIQSKRHREYYDKAIPDSKFLAFGSPKFDSVIKKCKNPPAIPDSWKDKIYDENGNKKKVYFYNTTIGGMLGNAPKFLDKMEYVFETFKAHPEACILWRPHPLLESTLDSMRPMFKVRYEQIRDRYISEDYGIYDKTPFIEDAIALSDVYIGDAGTSVTSLFGVVGKPIFQLNNSINSKPSEDDWKGLYFATSTGTRGKLDRYRIMPENKLYYAPNNDMHYEFCCNLSEYSGGGYYQAVADYGDKAYVLPASAQDILVVKDNKVIRKIEIGKKITKPGAFSGAIYYYKGEMMDKIFIFPYNYPSMVIFDTKTEKAYYMDGAMDFNIGMINGTKVAAAKWVWKDKLHILNHEGTSILTIDINTLEMKEKKVDFNRLLTGVACKCFDDDTIWLVPYLGTVLTSWKPKTNEIREYDVNIDGLKSIDRRFDIDSDIYMFSSVAFKGDNKIILSPNWGNKFIELDTVTGKASEWHSPIPVTTADKSPYIKNNGMGGFIRDIYDDTLRYWYAPERKTYNIDLDTRAIGEVTGIKLDKEDVASHITGYGKESDWNMYCCAENAFNSLEDLLTDNISGNQFNHDEEIEAYMTVNASPDGDCGKKVYQNCKKMTC